MVKKKRRGGNALRKKLLRDFYQSRLQFISMLLLCALGSWVFSGLDGGWRLLENSFETFYEQQQLADFWVQLPGASRGDFRRIAHLDGVEDAQLRVNIELDTDLGNDSSLLIYGYDELPRINVPLVHEGKESHRNSSRESCQKKQYKLACSSCCQSTRSCSFQIKYNDQSNRCNKYCLI